MKLLCTLCVLLFTSSCLAQLGATVDPTTHNVTLTWIGSVSKNVDHYKLYRTKIEGGPYNSIKLSIPKGKRTYVDSYNLISGKTYYYVMSTFDTAGVESGPSNEAVAKIP